jgi:hypothetical protein
MILIRHLLNVPPGAIATVLKEIIHRIIKNLSTPEAALCTYTLIHTS